ncbi:ribonuclease III [Desulfovibrio sulfodismutans]|uniref:Ribonuclease 3 n=1 Tax=Desulfolutivibrio sulfodismutans TaxID=63561 RepID=A0A7K3NQE4_9BACT|nr:ribonuclease III [Desulfolutivibrio sulfodismutans]NDY58424.1 ribonuclease III [Desulfolutivibrio sulfodismutans]QLA10790.1 ribonuclease III [Desulfolutivibrio sulfodismutans DSM 3696]
MKDALRKLQTDIGHDFSDHAILETALTHSSHANESANPSEHNERLEFLGDAVLELCVSEELFSRFPQAPEGALTLLRSKLVSEPALAELARKCDLDRCIRLGKGEESQGGRQRDSLLSDALEAIFAAVFLDGGFEAARRSIRKIFSGMWPESLVEPKSKDYKSRLQELTQKRYKARPVYSLADSRGPEHEKLFEVRLILPDGHEVTASGSSVKKAEQMAAKKALGDIRDTLDP